MLKHMEKRDGDLQSIDDKLGPIAALAAMIIESGLVAQLVKHLPELTAFIHRNFPKEEPKLFMADVLRYLGISERTYYRKLSEGKLKPRKWEGPDFFYRYDLEDERRESGRRGRI